VERPASRGRIEALPLRCPRDRPQRKERDLQRPRPSLDSALTFRGDRLPSASRRSSRGRGEPYSLNALEGVRRLDPRKISSILSTSISVATRKRTRRRKIHTSPLLSDRKRRRNDATLPRRVTHGPPLRPLCSFRLCARRLSVDHFVRSHAAMISEERRFRSFLPRPGRAAGPSSPSSFGVGTNRRRLLAPLARTAPPTPEPAPPSLSLSPQLRIRSSTPAAPASSSQALASVPNLLEGLHPLRPREGPHERSSRPGYPSADSFLGRRAGGDGGRDGPRLLRRAGGSSRR